MTQKSRVSGKARNILKLTLTKPDGKTTCSGMNEDYLCIVGKNHSICILFLKYLAENKLRIVPIMANNLVCVDGSSGGATWSSNWLSICSSNKLSFIPLSRFVIWSAETEAQVHAQYPSMWRSSGRSTFDFLHIFFLFTTLASFLLLRASSFFLFLANSAQPDPN